MLLNCLSSHSYINSKRVLLLLIWIFTINIFSSCTFAELTAQLHFSYSYLDSTGNTHHFSLYLFQSINYVFNAILLGFYTPAGLIADNKVGRFKAITLSSECLLVLLFLEYISLLVAIALPNYWNNTWRFIPISIVLYGLNLPIEASLVMFNANIIQFGVDQLQDSPADHQSLFIHWYVWLYYLSVLTTQLVFQSLAYISMAIIFFILAVVIIISLSIVLLTVHYNRHWFIIDTARSNPYKLVYRVTKFAHLHKVPIHRSAFTYCEDEIPKGLDLGKTKYGGPFTTEEVENVKAFYGIFKIIIALGIIFVLNYTSGRLSFHFFQPKYLKSIKYIIVHLILKNEVISSTVIVIVIPTYIVFIRPFVKKYYLTMLKRIGVGALLLVLSVTCSFVAITVNPTTKLNTNSTNTCVLDSDIYTINFTTAYYSFASIAFLLQQCLYALSAMFLYPALYEFICAQSPHAMKGMLIGLSFTIRGLFQLLGFILNILFLIINRYFLNCATDFYILTVVIGLVGLAVYVYVARKYKLRQRDEPCHVRRFVEDYYSKLQEEHYDY